MDQGQCSRKDWRQPQEIQRERKESRRTNEIVGLAAKAWRLSLTVSSTSAEHQALGGCLMRPKAMEDLAAFSATEEKRAAAEEKERDEYSSAQGQ